MTTKTPTTKRRQNAARHWTRRVVVASLVSLAVSPAFAQDSAVDQVVVQLRDQGYTVESVARTLLGRVRIIATRGGVSRELVIDPRNGVVLRDYSRQVEGDGPDHDGGGANTSSGGGSESGSGGDEDDDDDDGDDDDDDDDGDDDDSDDDEDDDDDDAEDGDDDDD